MTGAPTAASSWGMEDARGVLVRIGRSLPDDSLRAFAESLGSARLRRDIRAAARMPRDRLGDRLASAADLARRLRQLLLAPEVNVPEPSGLASRMEAYLAFEGSTLESFTASLETVERAANVELSGFKGGPESDWGSAGDQMVRDLAGLATEHFGVTVSFPRDENGTPTGPFVEFVIAVQTVWGDRGVLRGDAIRSAYNRLKSQRVQREGN